MSTNPQEFALVDNDGHVVTLAWFDGYSLAEAEEEVVNTLDNFEDEDISDPHAALAAKGWKLVPLDDGLRRQYDRVNA